MTTSECAENGGTKNGTFLLLSDLGFHADDIRHDLREASAFRAATGQAQRGDTAVDIALEGVDNHLHFMRAALKKCPHQIDPCVIVAKANQTATTVGVVIGRDLAGKERMEQQSPRTGRRLLSLVHHDRIGAGVAAFRFLNLIKAKIVTPPFKRSSETEGAALDIPGIRNAVTAPPQILALDPVDAIKMGNHDTGRADSEFRHALPDHAGPDGRALLVTGTAA